jgi:hypothetical protein
MSPDTKFTKAFGANNVPSICAPSILILLAEPKFHHTRRPIPDPNKLADVPKYVKSTKPDASASTLIRIWLHPAVLSSVSVSINAN